MLISLFCCACYDIAVFVFVFFVIVVVDIFLLSLLLWFVLLLFIRYEAIKSVYNGYEIIDIRYGLQLMIRNYELGNTYLITTVNEWNRSNYICLICLCSCFTSDHHTFVQSIQCQTCHKFINHDILVGLCSDLLMRLSCYTHLDRTW